MTGDHTAYVEVLAHVNCGDCGEYWGLSDISEAEIEAREWTCPHCDWTADVAETVRED